MDYYFQTIKIFLYLYTFFLEQDVPGRSRQKQEIIFQPCKKEILMNIDAWLQPSVADKVKLANLPEPEQTTVETDSRQLFRRMAGCWTYWGFKHGYFYSEMEKYSTTENENNFKGLSHNFHGNISFYNSKLRLIIKKS